MNRPQPLAGRVALVAGATRGAGRAIAVELARAAAFVYATGRSQTAGRSEIDRPEAIEETGDLIHATGGTGVALRVDHLQPDAVESLVGRVQDEQGRLDVLVNDIFGGGLVVEMTDGTSSFNANYREGVGFYYDLVKANVERIVKGLTFELVDHPVTALGVTPGWLRSENMLEHFGVTEDTWRDALAQTPGFAISESPTYVARGLAALAADEHASRFAGQIVTSRTLADTYDLTDTDGSRPDCWGYIAAHGIDEQSGKNVKDFR